MNNQIKLTIISAFLGFVIFIGIFLLFVSPILFTLGPNYTRQDLVENYNSKSTEIKDLVFFIKSKIPADKKLEIEFNNDDKLGIFRVTSNGYTSSNWDIPINSNTVDSLLRELNVTRDFLTDLKDKLDEANCIAIKSGEPMKIGFQRSGMGQYFYQVFEKNLDDFEIDKYNDSCKYIFYKDNIVLEYGGGVFGSHCFE
jgi:hypothetical protein